VACHLPDGVRWAAWRRGVWPGSAGTDQSAAVGSPTTLPPAALPGGATGFDPVTPSVSGSLGQVGNLQVRPLLSSELPRCWTGVTAVVRHGPVVGGPVVAQTVPSLEAASRQ